MATTVCTEKMVRGKRTPPHSYPSLDPPHCRRYIFRLGHRLHSWEGPTPNLRHLGNQMNSYGLTNFYNNMWVINININKKRCVLNIFF